MRVIFMGTPDFAVGTLEEIIKAGHEVALVVSQPDKAVGRSKALHYTPVKACALEHGIEVYQPQKVRDSECIERLRTYHPDIIIVEAFGQIIPRAILDMPRYGCVNVHASLLPKYRGAAPIQWAVINGDAVTGVTTMRMDEGLDTGDILETAETEISDTDNFETLHNRLSILGAELIVSTLYKIERGECKNMRQKQSNEGMTYAAKIEKSDCIVDFRKSNTEVFNTIRALSPTPLSYSFLGEKRIKFTEARLPSGISENINIIPGTVVSVSGGIITVKCGKGNIEITGVLPEGKKRTSSADFIRGRGICKGDTFK